MRHRSRRLLGLALACAAILAAAPALAQQVRQKIIEENPSRNVGGSCIYGGDGKLLHAPRGASCPESEQPPASPAPSTDGTAAALPASTRSEAKALLQERELLDVELARVREALAYEDREAARRAVDAALRKIALHLERERRLLHQLAGQSGGP